MSSSFEYEALLLSDDEVRGVLSAARRSHHLTISSAACGHGPGTHYSIIQSDDGKIARGIAIEGNGRVYMHVPYINKVLWVTSREELYGALEL